jgi:hypothetical protein
MLEPLSEKRIKEIRERAERNQERYTLYAAWDDIYELLNEVGRLKDELDVQHEVIHIIGTKDKVK